MQTYELTYIISSQISSEESEYLKRSIEQLIREKEGVILRSEKTLAKTLSYPMKKQSSGYFVTLTFQAPEDKIKEVNDQLEKEMKVLRHLMITKKPIKALKERRTRKPIFAETKPARIGYAQGLAGGEKNDERKVEVEEIEKKLDEILNE